jgi:tRNA pseudouridine13 synthase
VSAEIPGIDLRLREQLEDFQVEELPSFEPSGEGEHLFLKLEKRGRSTPDVARYLARRFQVEIKDVGWAGRKDTRAVTLQWFSVRGAACAGLEDWPEQDLRLIEATRNDRKLRLGALAGNRFQLCLRGIATSQRELAEQVLRKLQQSGMPNYFGPQRFGLTGYAAELGLLLICGRAREYLLRRLSAEHSPELPAVDELRAVIAEGRRSSQRQLGDLAPRLPHEFAGLAVQLARRPGDWSSALRSLDRSTLGLHLSAWQSTVFNRVLSERFDCWLQPERGDLLQLAGSRSLFPADESEDLGALRQRVESFELSISGPLPGDRAPLACGAPGDLERRLVMDEGGPQDQTYRLPVRGLQLPGTRRALRISLESLNWTWKADQLHLKFDLPPGSYATCVVSELTKNIDF